VLKPGIYPVTGQISLLRALALAGGYAQYADLQEIMLYRLGPDGKQVSQTYNLEQVRAGEVPDPFIQSDDVIVVKRDARRTTLRDSLFRDIIDTINPFSNR
jgi:polysaccharide biosynthesis/export protein